MLFPLYDHNPHCRFPWVTGLIILANVVVMFWLGSLDTRNTALVVMHNGFVPERLSQLENGQPVVVDVVEQPRRWEKNAVPQKLSVKLPSSSAQVVGSLFTMMFLHGGWLHLAMNMWMLWVFGNNIEDRLGHLVYGIYYLLGGILASLTHWVVDPHSTIPVIGASGAVAAVLGGYAVSYPTAKVRTLIFVLMVFIVDLPALLVLGVWFLLELVSGLGMLNGLIDLPIAFWAHIGGFVAGIVLIPIFALGATPPEIDWKKETEESFKLDDIDR